jgi:hypothetical protein
VCQQQALVLQLVRQHQALVLLLVPQQQALLLLLALLGLLHQQLQEP